MKVLKTFRNTAIVCLILLALIVAYHVVIFILPLFVLSFIIYCIYRMYRKVKGWWDRV